MNIIGLMWAKDESDIIEQTIEDALKHVDTLMVADDDSIDGTWEIIKSYSNRLEYIAQRKHHIKNEHPLQWARQHLLDETRKRFGYKDTWIQIVESDIMILDTDIREAIKRFCRDDVSVSWQTLNAVRHEWKPENDEYPNWSKSIEEVMPYAHWMEVMTYSFRPLPGLYYTSERKPWPRGFSKYNGKEYRKKKHNSPLLAHFGYRGPNHFYNKYKGRSISKHPTWDTSSVESILRTVPIFNGTWNNKKETFLMSRKGWIGWLG